MCVASAGLHGTVLQAPVTWQSVTGSVQPIAHAAGSVMNWHSWLTHWTPTQVPLRPGMGQSLMSLQLLSAPVVTADRRKFAVTAARREQRDARGYP